MIGGAVCVLSVLWLILHSRVTLSMSRSTSMWLLASMPPYGSAAWSLWAKLWNTKSCVIYSCRLGATAFNSWSIFWWLFSLFKDSFFTHNRLTLYRQIDWEPQYQILFPDVTQMKTSARPLASPAACSLTLGCQLLCGFSQWAHRSWK